MNRLPLCTGFDRSPMSRRQILSSFAGGLGALAASDLFASESGDKTLHSTTGDGLHFPAKAKRVIWLFQSGAPSQMDLFDHKPLLNEKHGQELPDEVRDGQRLTGMSGNQSSLPLAGSPFKFSQHGESGHWFSDILPHTAKIADDLCVVHSMYTEAINHGPGVTFMQTGSQFPGRPSMGAWLDYGLGSENSDLPAFVVLASLAKGGQPLVSRYWGNGFLPSKHQGVRFQPGDDPVLYLGNPEGLSSSARRAELDALKSLHEMELAERPDPAIETRIAQYELAYRMQTSIPEAADLSSEPQSTFDLYGEDAKTPGTYAANCVLARRLAERDVRFIQIYEKGWDHHGGLPGGIRHKTKLTDQASAALVTDLKQRGLLDDTLVIWGGEFGRTNYCQGKLTAKSFGRDHHPRCFSLWMAGGGVNAGHAHGLTDPYGYNILEGGVHIHDFHATLLHLLGIDHERLTFKFQGRQFRLTDVHGHVQNDLIA